MLGIIRVGLRLNEHAVLAEIADKRAIFLQYQWYLPDAAARSRAFAVD
jgi:hypothetical protein